jgi:hypothetical protein
VHQIVEAPTPESMPTGRRSLYFFVQIAPFRDYGPLIDPVGV